MSFERGAQRFEHWARAWRLRDQGGQAECSELIPRRWISHNREKKFSVVPGVEILVRCPSLNGGLALRRGSDGVGSLSFTLSSCITCRHGNGVNQDHEEDARSLWATQQRGKSASWLAVTRLIYI